MCQVNVAYKIGYTFSVQWRFFENLAVYEIMWKSVLDPDRPRMAVRSMRYACWIFKATNTHSECVTLIAFPLKQWLHERTSMLRYTYSVCLVLLGFWVSVWSGKYVYV